MAARKPLPPGPYCHPEGVAGWTYQRGYPTIRLFDPSGKEVSPNLAPGDVRDSFRNLVLSKEDK